jgi:tight adherence protein C
MTEWLELGFLFASVALGSFALLRLLVARQERLTQRLQDTDGEAASAPRPEYVFGDLTPALAEQVPVTASSQEELRQELREAGYYAPSAVMQYAAVRAVLVLLPLFAAAVAALMVARAQMPVVVILGVIGAGLGFSLPRAFVNYRARVRKREIERGLPVAVDLLTLGLSGGQNIFTALERVSRELRLSYPVLGSELEVVRRQAQYSSLPQALHQWSDRVRIPEVRNLVMILTQSERLGTDIAGGLLEFASNFRTTLRQRADAQANRAAFWMLFPTMFGLWIPAAIILIGPVFFEFWHRREEARTTLMQRQAQLGRMREEQSRAAAGTTLSPEERGEP